MEQNKYKRDSGQWRRVSWQTSSKVLTEIFINDIKCELMSAEILQIRRQKSERLGIPMIVHRNENTTTFRMEKCFNETWKRKRICFDSDTFHVETFDSKISQNR